jgi:hypothetical protein
MEEVQEVDASKDLRKVPPETDVVKHQLATITFEPRPTCKRRRDIRWTSRLAQ